MTFTIFCTGLTWAWVVATVVEVMKSMDMFNRHFNEVMDDMNQLMLARGVTPGLQTRIRKHLHEAYNVHRSRHNQMTLKWLSDGLQGELAIASGVDKVCRCVWYFRDLKQQWVVDLAQHFEAEMFSPGEFVVDRSRLFVLRKGSCAKRGRVLTQDSVIGEDFILVTPVLRDTACPRTLTLCETMALSVSALRATCEQHTELNRRLRRAQVRLAVWRAFIYVAD